MRSPVATSEKTRQGLKLIGHLRPFWHGLAVATSEKTRQGLKRYEDQEIVGNSNVATSEKTRQGLKRIG
jgi:hypothetical protein